MARQPLVGASHCFRLIRTIDRATKARGVTAESGSGTVEDDRRKEVLSTRVRCAPVKLAVRYGPIDSQTRLSKLPVWLVE